MSQEETMRLVAEVVDKYSGPMRDMMSSLKKIGATSQEIHQKGWKDTTRHTAAYKELGEGLSKTRDLIAGSVTPAMATLGIGVYGVSETINAFAENLKSAAEKYNLFNQTVKRGGVSAQYVGVLSKTFERLGMDGEKASEAIGEIGETFDKLKRHSPQEMNRLTAVFGNTLPYLDSVVRGAKNREEAISRIARSITDEHIPIDQRRKLAQGLGIDPALAAKTGAEFGKALRESIEQELKHPTNLPLMHDLEEAFIHLRQAQSDFRTDMINTFGPSAVKMINTFADAMERASPNPVRQMAKPFESGVGKEIAGGLAQWYGRVLTAPMHMFGGDDKKTEDTIAKGTKQGVLDAFLQYLASIHTTSEAKDLAAGIRPMAFHPGGGGPGGGTFGSRDFPAMSPEQAQSIEKSARGIRQDFSLPKSMGRLDGSGSGINRDHWREQLNADPALKERFFRHSLGENQDPTANQAIMEEAANRADIRGNRRFDDHGNLSYFAGYYKGKITDKMRKMLDSNFDKVFSSGSDVSHGAIDNSSGWLAAKHLNVDHRFKDVFVKNGEHFEVPDRGESGRGERARYPEFRAGQLREAAERLAATHGAHLADHIRAGHRPPTDASMLRRGMKAVDAGSMQGTVDVNVNHNNIPRGVTAKVSSRGDLIKSVTLNRGRNMPLASET